MNNEHQVISAIAKIPYIFAVYMVGLAKCKHDPELVCSPNAIYLTDSKRIDEDSWNPAKTIVHDGIRLVLETMEVKTCVSDNFLSAVICEQSPLL